MLRGAPRPARGGARGGLTVAGIPPRAPVALRRPTGGAAYAVDTATGDVDHPEVLTAQFLASTGPPAPNAYAADVNDLAAGDVDVTVEVACANATVTSPPLTVRRVK